MTRLYLVRHGETDLNEKGCYYGWTDCKLTQKGIHQAMLLHHAFEDINISAAISSDLIRAIDTAEIICSEKNIEIRRDERLREMNFGAWEGMHYKDIMSLYKECFESWAEDWQNTAPLQGESFAGMRERVIECINQIVEEQRDKDILIVAHQGALRIIITYLLDISSDKIWSFFFEHGAYSVLTLQDNNWVIQNINKT